MLRKGQFDGSVIRSISTGIHNMLSTTSCTGKEAQQKGSLQRKCSDVHYYCTGIHYCSQYSSLHVCTKQVSLYVYEKELRVIFKEV